jgi:hypothetical protein
VQIRSRLVVKLPYLVICFFESSKRSIINCKLLLLMNKSRYKSIKQQILVLSPKLTRSHPIIFEIIVQNPYYNTIT